LCRFLVLPGTTFINSTLSYFTQTGAASDENTEAKFQQTWTLWVVSCCVSNISVIADVISPSRPTQKSSQHVRACATGDGAICSCHIMWTVELARAYGLHPRLWLLYWRNFNIDFLTGILSCRRDQLLHFKSINSSLTYVSPRRFCGYLLSDTLHKN